MSNATKTPTEQWQEELKANATRLGRFPLIVRRVQTPDDVEDEDTWEPTNAQIVADVRVAFIKESSRERLAQFAKRLGNVDGDSDDEGDGFRMTNTVSSYHGHECMNAATQVAKQLLTINRFEEAFDVALAATMAGWKDDYWYMDTDDEEAVNAIFSGLTKVWDRLLMQPDSSLGLPTALEELGSEAAVAEATTAAQQAQQGGHGKQGHQLVLPGTSREAIVCLLKEFQSEVNNLGYFSWVQLYRTDEDEGEDDGEDGQDGDEDEDGEDE